MHATLNAGVVESVVPVDNRSARAFVCVNFNGQIEVFGFAVRVVAGEEEAVLVQIFQGRGLDVLEILRGALEDGRIPLARGHAPIQI
jgi:hypothetical protein